MVKQMKVKKISLFTGPSISVECIIDEEGTLFYRTIIEERAVSSNTRW